MTNKTKLQKKWPLALAALGVVFGDIGTSPLYAMSTSLRGLTINADNVLGVLSLIFWVLILVISTRYMSVFLQADNRGEGGVLALLALLKKKHSRFYQVLFVLGVLGAGLLLGDGMITPAISVLSAIEGVEVLSPKFAYFIVPITVAILLILFLCQRLGTGKIGNSFGPIILIWLVTIGGLGLARIWQNPMVIEAINPYYAFKFFYHNGWVGYKLLGGVFLVITGAEALYADLGHFGRTPIRLGWFLAALPALLLNYFGQGAYLIHFPQAIANPFYTMAPVWFLYPLLILATLATIIASQAVISASFSLTKQAMLLNLCPRFTIVQTSKVEHGQIYVPQINLILALGTLMLVLFFRQSQALAGAYGLAVNLVMIIVAVFVITVAYQRWRWSILRIIWVFFTFSLIDLAFLGANAHKLLEGGWIPLVFALVCAIIMFTWEQGIELLRSSYYMAKGNLAEMSEGLDRAKLYFLPKASTIFIADPNDQSGGSFLHHLRKMGILPSHILIVSVAIARYPVVPIEQCFEVIKISERVCRLILHFGFTQTTDVHNTLRWGVENGQLPFELDMDHVLYLVEAISINVTNKKHTGLYYWQKRIFKILFRNSAVDFKFFRLPYARTITLGTSCKI